ncbi:MAG: cupin domain-containing protein [Candidatus Xenobia bacterium]
MTVEVIRWEDDSAPSVEESQDLLRTEGYAPFIWSDAPGTTCEDHQHDHDECLWFVSGQMEMAAQGEQWLLGPGDRLVLPRGTLHRARVVGTQSVRSRVGQR